MLVPRGRFPLQTGGFPPCAACRVRAELAPSLPHGLGSLVTVSGLGKVAVAGGAPSARFLPGSLRWGLAVSHARFGTVPGLGVGFRRPFLRLLPGAWRLWDGAS